MAHKKGAGSSSNGRESHSKRLGIKIYGGQFASSGAIIVRQRGTVHSPGINVGIGKDHTLFALTDGLADAFELLGHHLVGADDFVEQHGHPVHGAAAAGRWRECGGRPGRRTAAATKQAVEERAAGGRCGSGCGRSCRHAVNEAAGCTMTLLLLADVGCSLQNHGCT